MADKEILERIDRFENRIKANFLEIEKRLVNLEAMSPESAESMKDRIKELEDASKQRDTFRELLSGDASDPHLHLPPSCGTMCVWKSRPCSMLYSNDQRLCPLPKSLVSRELLAGL